MTVFSSDDLRSIKTERALYGAILSVLKRQSFKKITVKGICEEALISRAAFYAHYVDKYNLVKCWLTELWGQVFAGLNDYSEIEKIVESNIGDIVKVMKNLAYDVDNELFGIIFDLILSAKKAAPDKEDCHKSVVLSNFYAGGICSYLVWQIRNKFPAEVPLMNRAIFEMLCEFKNS